MVLSPIDRLISRFDAGLRAACGTRVQSSRPYPAEEVDGLSLDEGERRHAAGLMRVNHAGEIAAQALYEGQALLARSEGVRDTMRRAAKEEEDHLSWCQRRLEELESQPSRLVPVWYVGSYAIGAAAGAIGDAWSLGFVAETERQVVAHLHRHLARLPGGDARSRAILTAMAADESRHATAALGAGAREVPSIIKRAMSACSRAMTTCAYWI